MHKNDDEFFDRSLADLGGRFSPNTIDKGFVEYLQIIRQQSQDFIRIFSQYVPTMPIVGFEFADDPGIGAWALTDDRVEKHGIAFSFGLPLLLSVAFQRLLADGRVLPQIGNAALEERELPAVVSPIAGVIRPDFWQMHDLSNWGGIPKDPQRQVFANIAVQMAMNFVLCHELFHISNGHLRWLKQAYGIRTISEFSFAPTMHTPEFFLAMQTLEMDADMCASGTSLATYVKAHIHNGEGPFQGSGFDNTEALTHAWLFSINILFRLLGDERLICEATNKSHPTSSIRMYMSWQNVKYALKSALSTNEFDVTSIRTQAFTDSYYAMNYLAGRPPRDILGLQDVFRSNEAEIYTNRLKQNWRKVMRPELAALSYVELAE